MTRDFFRLLFFSSAAFLCFSAGVSRAWASPTATATTLTVTSGGSAASSVASGSMVTLTAAVVSGSTKVTVGQVNFCDASANYCTDIHLLGMAQLTGAGTAVFNFHPGIGSHSYKAVFAGTPNGTPAYAASSSSTAALTVAGTFPTTTTIASSGSAGNYTLTATVTGSVNASGLAAPAGTVSFLDTSNSNASLGTAPLGTGTEALSWNSLTATSPFDPDNLTAPLVADFNGDGKPDLVILAEPAGNQVAVLLGNGDGTFTEAPNSPFTVPTTGEDAASGVLVGDFNGDGKPDLAVGIEGVGDANKVMILLGKGDGTFTEAPGSPVSFADVFLSLVAVGDFNGDGNLDLLLFDGFSTIQVLFGNGDGTFSATPGAVSTVTDFQTVIVVQGDFNGDGNLDIVGATNTNGASGTGYVTLYLGNGDGTFTAQPAISAGLFGPVSVAAADFNGDGKLDLAIANGYLNSVVVWLGNGDGTFTEAPQTSPTLNYPTSMAAGDFNQDGKTDLVVGETYADPVLVLLGNGDGTFSTTTAVPAADDVFGESVADFNGDGLPDFATQPNTELVQVVLTQLTQTATATATGISPVGTGTHQVDASYPGNTLYSPSVSTTTGLTAVPPPSFAITGTAVTVTAGATTGNTSTITITPAGGFTGSVALTAAVTAGPSGASLPPTFSFGATTPVNIAGTTAGSATLTITTTAPTSGTCTSANQTPRQLPWYAGGGAVLACVFLFGIPARRRRWRSMLGMVLLLFASVAGLVACGGGGGGGCTNVPTAGTTAGTYTVTVTGTSNALTETGTVTLTVQ